MFHRAVLAFTLLAASTLAAAAATDRGRLQAFMEVTGYDVVIDSLQLGAMAGPGLVGDAPATFGGQYRRLAQEVFDPKVMRARALDILSAVMPETLVDAGADFYASDLGQKMVTAENAAHVTDDGIVAETGSALVDAMRKDDPARIDILNDLRDAVGSEEVAQRGAVEIQVRFILAARAAGVLPDGPGETELRAILLDAAKEQSAENATYALISNAYTYREISDEDLRAYVEALKSPEMSQVYEILDAVQYQVMIERYEALGARLGDLAPQQDL